MEQLQSTQQTLFISYIAETKVNTLFYSEPPSKRQELPVTLIAV